jgi:hypothetical protein
MRAVVPSQVTGIIRSLAATTVASMPVTVAQMTLRLSPRSRRAIGSERLADLVIRKGAAGTRRPSRARTLPSTQVPPPLGFVIAAVAIVPNVPVRRGP